MDWKLFLVLFVIILPMFLIAQPHTVILKFDGTPIPDIKSYQLFKVELPDTNEFWDWDSKPLDYVPYRTIQHTNHMYYLDTTTVNLPYAQFAVLQMDKSGNIDKKFNQLSYVVELQDSVTVIDIEVSGYRIKQRKY